MEREFFKGQSGFFMDYKKVVKDPNFDEKAVIKAVLEQLDLPDEHGAISYVISGSQTKSGQAVKFPFKKEMVIDAREATMSDEFFYEGEPFQLDYKDHEQI